MVDPNPGRGMAPGLARYWLHGKGAAKIRWGLPHDFDRCVQNLRKYFPTSPEGLCNNLHQRAVGAPPGKGHGHSVTASAVTPPDALVAAQSLLDRQPKLGAYMWAGPLAPIGRPTGEPRRTRIFEPGALNHRVLPLPLDWREKTGEGHMGSVTVGRILGITYGPDHLGRDFAWGYGDLLDEEIVPAAKHARYLMEQGVAGPSLDPGGRVEVTVNPETGFEHMTRYGIGGATLVSIPAFAELRPHVFGPDADWPDDDPDYTETYTADDDCGCGGSGEPHSVAVVPAGSSFTVSTSGWRGLPLAPRDSVFDNDDAVKRITAWAGGGQDVSKMRRAFMYYDPQLPPADPTSYRLPVGDVINGRLTLVFHAIYAAAALLSGAHGGLPNIPDQDKEELRAVISAIYPEMAKAFSDSSIRAPWDRSAQEGVQLSMDTFATTDEGFPLQPPKSWFQDPKLQGKTRLTVTEDGRVFGHLAAWNECHRDVAQRECVMAPKSATEYAAFHLGSVLTSEGEEIEVGKIVMDTRHAHIGLGYSAAALHYDNTGDDIAVIRCGEDQFGIWFAGAVVADATKKKVAKLRRSPLSGDWRRERGNLELTAALAVNTPAFPVYSMEHEQVDALVAAGSVWFDDVVDVEEPVVIPATGIDELAAEVENTSAIDRAQRLRDMMEDEEIYATRDREERLQRLFAASSAPAPAPLPAGAPVVAPVGAPPAAAPAPAAAPGSEVPAPVPGEAAEAGQDDWAGVVAQQQASTRYSVIEEGQAEDPAVAVEAPATPAPAAAPAAAAVPPVATK